MVKGSLGVKEEPRGKQKIGDLDVREGAQAEQGRDHVAEAEGSGSVIHIGGSDLSNGNTAGIGHEAGADLEDEKEGGDTLKASSSGGAASLNDLFRGPLDNDSLPDDGRHVVVSDGSGPSSDIPTVDAVTSTSRAGQDATTSKPSRLSSLFLGWSDPILVAKAEPSAASSQYSSLPSTPVTTRRGKTLSVSGPIFPTEAKVAQEEIDMDSEDDDAEWESFLVSC